MNKEVSLIYLYIIITILAIKFIIIKVFIYYLLYYYLIIIIIYYNSSEQQGKIQKITFYNNKIMLMINIIYICFTIMMYTTTIYQILYIITTTLMNKVRFRRIYHI